MASRELSILVTAKNMASKVLGSVKGDVNSLESATKRAGSNMGRNLAVAGTVAAGAIAVQIKSGIDSLVELERVNNLTEAAIKSTGGAAGVTAEQVRGLAEEYENLTGVDDKVIQNAENLLMTFTNVKKDAFEPTLEAALNLNAALGGGDEGLQGTLLQVAKAVNDPVKGMTALRRSGVSFTEAQIKQVKEMVKANDLMGAQALILGELETQFGGAAAAANQGVGAAQKRFADSIEDMQMSLAKGFLPLIERVSGAMQRLVADPQFMAGVEAFGDTLASGFDQALDFAEGVDWGAIGNALSAAGTGARMAMDAFLGAPPWLQTAILTGWGLNKLTGGALGSIVGALGSGLVKGVLGMNAGVVNINAATVNGGGLPGAAAKGGGFLGGLGKGLLTGGVVGGAAVAAGAAAVTVKNFEEMRAEQRDKLGGILDEMPRTPEKIDQSIAAIQAQIDMERPILDGILFNTNVKPQLEQEIAELRQVKAAQERGVAAARDAIPWHQRNVQAINTFNASEGTRFANLGGKVNAQVAKQAEALAAVRGQTGILAQIRNKKTSVTAIVNTSVNVNLQQWQRAHVSSVRANSNSGGFI